MMVNKERVKANYFAIHTFSIERALRLRVRVENNSLYRIRI